MADNFYAVVAITTDAPKILLRDAMLSEGMRWDMVECARRSTEKPLSFGLRMFPRAWQLLTAFAHVSGFGWFNSYHPSFLVAVMCE